MSILRQNWVNIVLVALLIALQLRLWLGKNSVPDYRALQQQVGLQAQKNANLGQRNALLKADIDDLTIGLDAIEERARSELGLIKAGETFYRILPNEINP
jgi:cell division protein FtsB